MMRKTTSAVALLAYAIIGACGGEKQAPPQSDAPPDAAPATPAAGQVDPVERRPRFGVFNACGATGVAARAAETLKSVGYDLVLVDNYRDPATGRKDFARPTTEVLYADENFRAAAEDAAELFGVGPSKVRRDKVSRRVDVALVLGADFDRTALVVKTAGEPSDEDFDWSSLPVVIKLGPPPRSLDDGIYVSKANHTVTLFRGGEMFRQYPCATGRDDCTPEGTFTVNVKLVDPVWYWKGKAIPPGPDNGLGSRFISITNSQYPKGYGLHGTNEPGSIGRDASHGCVRMLNEDVEALFEEIKTGDKVVVGP